MAGEKSIFLFCVPRQETYQGKSLDEIATKYKMMAISGFNNFVEFEQGYEPGESIPDAPLVYVLKKEDRFVRIRLFLEERVKRIGKNPGKFSLNSYLLNPEDSEGRLLPDAEIIEISHKQEDIKQTLEICDPKKVYQEFKEFYSHYGWNIRLHPYDIPKPTMLSNWNRNKFLQAPQIVNPQALIALAEIYGYNREKLCWT